MQIVIRLSGMLILPINRIAGVVGLQEVADGTIATLPGSVFFLLLRSEKLVVEEGLIHGLVHLVLSLRNDDPRVVLLNLRLVLVVL